MGGMPDTLYLPSCLRLSWLLLTGWVRKIMKQKSRKIIRRFTAMDMTVKPLGDDLWLCQGPTRRILVGKGHSKTLLLAKAG
jgi:hypothetical protein